MQSFYEYMTGRYGSDDYIPGKTAYKGENSLRDLTYDMRNDLMFPKKATDPAIIERHLILHRACGCCLAAFRKAWTEYQKERSAS